MSGATVRVDETDPTPPYEQVRRQLAELVDDGTLAVGARLPTVRQLAGDLGLATGTVARAYRELEQAGYLTTARRAGTTVATRPHPRQAPPTPTDPTTDGGEGPVRAAAAAYVSSCQAHGATRDEALDAVRALWPG